MTKEQILTMKEILEPYGYKIQISESDFLFRSPEDGHHNIVSLWYQRGSKKIFIHTSSDFYGLAEFAKEAEEAIMLAKKLMDAGISVENR